MIKLNQNLRKEMLEKQVKIEHLKLKIAWIVFTVFGTLFFVFSVLSLAVIAILASWAGNNFKMKLIGMFISFLYLITTICLTILFRNLAFNNSDVLIIAGHTGNLETIWKYKSEILAERKLREKGLIE